LYTWWHIHVDVYIQCKEVIRGYYQPTILSHNNVLTRGTMQMLPHGRT
jgi:hypothetical protein